MTTGAASRIGVNLLWLVPGVVGGTEEYTTRLLAGLANELPPDIDVVLFANRSTVGAYPELTAELRTVVAPFAGGNKAVRVAMEATWLAAAARRERVALLHHAGGTIPPIRLSPAVVTIHDLQPLLLPDNFNAIKRWYLGWRIPATARQSKLVITITEYTKRTIVERLGIPAEHVVLVPPGYTVSMAEEPEHDPIATYGLGSPFFVYPAITYPHKNHLVLVRALAKVVTQHPDALLVLTSNEAQMEGAIGEEIDRLGLADNVRRLGRIPRGDIDWIVRHATAVVFPSRYEGFGLPVLEAMGNGCPVIAADATALPEVVGEAGILVDPDDADGWAAAMARMLDDPAAREWHVEAGFARAASYRWSASTKALVDAYRRVLGKDVDAP